MLVVACKHRVRRGALLLLDGTQRAFLSLEEPPPAGKKAPAKLDHAQLLLKQYIIMTDETILGHLLLLRPTTTKKKNEKTLR